MKITQSKVFKQQEYKPVNLPLPTQGPRQVLVQITPNTAPVAMNHLPPIYHTHHSLKMLPSRMVSQIIGRPFEIRIPSAEMQFLQQQIKELKHKCQELERKYNQRQESSNQGDKDIETTMMEISKSRREIEEHIARSITGTSNNGVWNHSSVLDGKGDDLVDIEDNMRDIKTELERKEKRILDLEAVNRNLESQLTSLDNYILKADQMKVHLQKQLGEC